MIGLISGVAVVVVILLLVAQFVIPRREDGNGYWDMLRLFVVLFSLTLLLIIPKSTIDELTVCEVVPSNSTTVAGVTYYNFTDYCYERVEQSPHTFYRATLWFVRVFWAVVLIYLVIETVMFIGRLAK